MVVAKNYSELFRIIVSKSQVKVKLFIKYHQMVSIIIKMSLKKMLKTYLLNKNLGPNLLYIDINFDYALSSNNYVVYYCS